MSLVAADRLLGRFLVAPCPSRRSAVTPFAAVSTAPRTWRTRRCGALLSRTVTVAMAAACMLVASAAAAQTIVPVSSAAQLQGAVAALQSNTTIVLAPGIYTLNATLTVNGPLTDVTIRGATGNRDDVVITGPGMNIAADTLHAIQTVGAVTRLTVSDLSITEFPGSAVFIGAGASSPRVRNVHLMNSGRTFVDTASTFAGADAGLVEYSLIEYVAPALAKTNDTGAVHIRGGANWVVRRNTFRRIWFGGLTGLSFAAVLANFGSSATLAENNVIIDCQRGISFGLIDQVGTFDHVGGIIRNNVIYRSGQLEPLGIGGDVGIHVADATGTRVAHNTILQLDGYPFAIEYRYPATSVTIKNNLVDKIILQREGAVAALANNYTSATPAMFVNPAAADLHLVPSAAAAIDAGAAVVTEDGLLDLDGGPRPLSGTLPDIGADEFGAVGPTITTASPLQTATVGVSYSVQLIPSGPPWTLVAGVMPPGLSLSNQGLIAGVPTASGTYMFIVRYTGGGGGITEKTFSLPVNAAPLLTLTVTKAGTGTGTVTSNPAGISCGIDCTESYVSGTVVALTPTPAAGSTFSGWSGDADCSDGTMTMSAARSCQATFTLLPNTLSVTKAGTGSGTVTSNPAGISCGIDCTESYVSGTVVALTPTPAAGSTFGGWSGDADCSDGTVTMSAARTCQATFTLLPNTLSVTKAGTGIGTVTSNPAGISCGIDCTESYVSGTVVALTPTPAAGSTFGGWSGDADCSDGTVTMSAARTCQATFTLLPNTLSVTKAGTGIGTVTSNPAGISCGLDCAESYASGTVVALTPTPAAGSTFSGWSGNADCSDGTVTMSAARTCQATFTLLPNTLSVTKAGTGSGTVTSNPAGISCGLDCAESYASGTVVTLTATAAGGSAFGGWSGDVDCSDGTVTLTAARSCQATFNAAATAGITRVTPAEGPLAGGTVITITGANFLAGAVVSVGGASATNVVLVNPTTIMARTPAAAVAGPREVVVTSPGGTAAMPNGFTYVAERTEDILDDPTKTLPPGSDFLQPALSGDGRYLAYVVTSDAVIPGDSNGVADVVVRDRVARTVTRVSVASDGTPANGRSGRPRISASGRYVAFWSEASNLVPGDTNGVRDVFLHDRDADGDGVFDETTPGARTTTRVSVASNGTQGDAASALDGAPLVPGVAADGQLDLSPDGLWVVFTSHARTLVPDDTNGVADIFLRSVTGQDTTRVSVAAGGIEADGASQSPAVSAGARWIAFASTATNLVPGDTNGLRDVFLVERATGQVVRLTEIVTRVGATVVRVDGNGASDTPSIDDAGRVVAFVTRATNLVPALAASTTAQIVVATLSPALPPGLAAAAGPSTEPAARPLDDRENPSVDVSRQLVSGVQPPGTSEVQPGDRPSSQPEVCGNGTCLGYATEATNLSPEVRENPAQDVVRQPVVTPPPPAPPPVQSVSTDVQGNPTNEPSTLIALSEDGGVVAIESEAPLTPEVTALNPAGTNVFVRALPTVVATVFPVAARVDQPATVTLRGSGFQTGAVVRFGTVASEGAVTDEGRTLTVTTPTAPSVAPGVVAVTVQNPDGSTVPLFQAFTFLPEAVQAPPGDTDADGLPDAWEISVGLDPQSAAGADGDAGDPDADGRTNLAEYIAGTHPRGTFTRYLAEGASSAFFSTTIGLANPSATHTAHAWLRFQKSDGTEVPLSVDVPPLQARMVTVNTLPGFETAQTEFATVVESDEALAVHRTMTWDPGRGYGSHLEAAVLAPAPRWYLAEGSTLGGFQLFYLIQNPGTTPAEVEVKFLLPSGPPLVKTYTVAAGARFNVWVNDMVPELANTDVSAVVTALTGGPIIVERAMYLTGADGLVFGAGHESAGVTAPALQWFLAEGATGSFFDLFVLIANPGDTAAELEVTYLLPDGTTLVKPYRVAPTSRFNIWVDLEDARLADTAVSTTVRSTNGVPVLVERAMWWPGGGSGWYEGHNSFGATQTGTQWAFGGGEITAAPKSAATYVLVANTATWNATVDVTVLFEDGTEAVKRTFEVLATSRFNVDVAAFFPEAVGKRFGVVVESVAAGGQPAAEIVVEGAVYHNDTNGVVWAAGANALATRLR